jgi:hypothetical protein
MELVPRAAKEHRQGIERYNQHVKVVAAQRYRPVGKRSSPVS